MSNVNVFWPWRLVRSWRLYSIFYYQNTGRSDPSESTTVDDADGGYSGAVHRVLNVNEEIMLSRMRAHLQGGDMKLLNKQNGNGAIVSSRRFSMPKLALPGQTC